MKVIIPLAGPGFELPSGATKAETLIEGVPHLRLALDGRSWRKNAYSDSYDLIFVLQDSVRSRQFATGSLKNWYPHARVVYIGGWTQGAAFTCLAGASLISDSQEPICIDLADICFEGNWDSEIWSKYPNLGGFLLTFESENPIYSFAKISQEGDVLETAEKRVISNHASAGVYFFRNISVLLSAYAHVFTNREQLSYRGIFFVCPLLNGVIRQGFQVKHQRVENVRDIKMFE